ncbi:MAG TPA: hypothetical protein PLP29_15375 [Candidatus Ozemobacteraceae bacterium]|nr:hypothetical protein [Candidatus Ozemobacteraceae bacterium]
MIRFQPSWILESLPPDAAKSLFMPLVPRPSSLMWFKRLGIRMYVNDPLESRAMLLRTLLAEGERFTEQNRRRFNRVIRKSLDLQMNPFRNWENKPFSASQLDYLFYWREAAFEISEPVQRDIFWSAVSGVMAHWMAMTAAGTTPAFPPDELLACMLRRREEQLFESAEKVYALHLPIEELGEEVEAELFVVPLQFQGRKPFETDHDVMYHAWFRGDPDLHAALGEIEAARRGWVFDWKNGCNTDAMIAKSGKAAYAVFIWSGADLPPRWHEENVAAVLRNAFSTRFPASVLRVKAADAGRDDYDFLLTMARPGYALPADLRQSPGNELG